VSRTAALLAVLLIAAALSAALPVELFVSDAPRPAPNKIVTPGGVTSAGGTPPWLYAWRAALVMMLALFAALVASFFTKMAARARLALAAISALAAGMHYLALLLTSSPPGFGIAVYPLFYEVRVGSSTSQLYLDIGQLLLAYSAYSLYVIYRARRAPRGRESRLTSRISPRAT
jgi:hypothetical protein